MSDPKRCPTCRQAMPGFDGFDPDTGKPRPCLDAFHGTPASEPIDDTGMAQPESNLVLCDFRSVGFRCTEPEGHTPPHRQNEEPWPRCASHNPTQEMMQCQLYQHHPPPHEYDGITWTDAIAQWARNWWTGLRGAGQQASLDYAKRKNLKIDYGTPQEERERYAVWYEASDGWWDAVMPVLVQYIRENGGLKSIDTTPKGPTTWTLGTSVVTKRCPVCDSADPEEYGRKDIDGIISWCTPSHHDVFHDTPRAEESQIPDPASEPDEKAATTGAKTGQPTYYEVTKYPGVRFVLASEADRMVREEREAGKVEGADLALDGFGGAPVSEGEGWYVCINEDGDVREYDTAKDAVRGVFDYGMELGKQEADKMVREAHAQGWTDCMLSDPCGDAVREAMDQALQNSLEAVKNAKAGAAMEEREACARVADGYDQGGLIGAIPQVIAAAIRARRNDGSTD